MPAARMDDNDGGNNKNRLLSDNRSEFGNDSAHSDGQKSIFDSTNNDDDDDYDDDDDNDAQMNDEGSNNDDPENQFASTETRWVQYSRCLIVLMLIGSAATASFLTHFYLTKDEQGEFRKQVRINVVAYAYICVCERPRAVSKTGNRSCL